MPGLSNTIEEFILDLMNDAESGIIEIQRNEMAEHFDCSPSQINYVLSTRFTPYKGYYIESRRGGGGYIRIMKVSLKDQENSSEIIMESIGDSITKNKGYHLIDSLYEEEFINRSERDIIKAATGDSVLLGDSEDKNMMRANILKNILLILMK